MSEWFCEILGEQLGPMPWSELVYLAERGNLSASHLVRHGSQGNWQRAGEVAGLPVAAADRTVSQAALADEEKAFEIGPGEREGLFEQLIAAPAANGWVASSSEEDRFPSPVGVVAHDGTDFAANRRPTVQSPENPVSATFGPSSLAIGLAEPSPPALFLPASTTAAKRPASKLPASRGAGPRRDSAGTSRFFKPSIIVTAVAAVAVAGWFGLNKGMAEGPPYRAVLRGYELRYQELTAIRQTRPDARSSRVFAARFKIGVASLRQRLTAADPVGDNLRAAGALLDAMSATAFSTAGSEDEAKYLQQERQFHDLLASAKTSLGVTTQ